MHREFPCFDGLRAIAATSVLLHHAGFQTGASFRGGVGPYLARFDAGVTVFFLISGFLLYRPFVVAHLSGGPVMPLRRFWRRRFLRIFPAYWVALTGVVLFFGVQLHGIRDWVTFYGLVQIYDSRRFFGAISQAWSLATEISFYLFLPLYASVVRRLGRGREGVEWAGLGVLVAVGLAFRSLLYPVRDPGFPASTQFLMRYWLPAHLDLFALGMAMAVASVQLERRGREPFTGGLAGRAFPWVSWGLAAGALWVVAHKVGLTAALADASPAREWARHLLYAAMAVFLILPAVFGPQREGLVRRFLASRPMIGLGLVSYGIYLWHQAWLGKARGWTGGQLFDASLWKVAGLAFVLSVAVATASYLVVERPTLALKEPRRRRRERSDEPALAPAVLR